jgi:hemoglobin
MSQTESANIFAKIGGINALHDIIDNFYDRVLEDPIVNGFFKGADMDIQRGKMKAFLMMALGGPIKFTGKDMRVAHVHLVNQGLTDIHFTTVGKHLDEALQEYGVDDETRKGIAEVVESCRVSVLNK